MALEVRDPDIRLALYAIPEPLALVSNTAPVAGVLTLPTPVVPQSRLWKVERINVQSTSTLPSICTVYFNAILPQYQSDTTFLGNQDVADEVQPITVPGGYSLLIQWTGLSSVGTDGKTTIVAANVQYSVYKLHGVGGL